MSKFRKNFTLSIDTIKILASQKNESEIVDKAVPFYLANLTNPPKIEKKIKKPLKVLTI